jgi:hypothetical protein
MQLKLNTCPKQVITPGPKYKIHEGDLQNQDLPPINGDAMIW